MKLDEIVQTWEGAVGGIDAVRWRFCDLELCKLKKTKLTIQTDSP